MSKKKAIEMGDFYPVEIPFTYGKWEVTKWSSHKHLNISCNDGFGNMTFIADCGNAEDIGELPYNPQVLNNAKLISKAPELLELLEEAVYHLDRMKLSPKAQEVYLKGRDLIQEIMRKE